MIPATTTTKQQRRYSDTICSNNAWSENLFHPFESHLPFSFWHSFAPRPLLKIAVESKFIRIQCGMQLVYHRDNTNTSWRRVASFRFILNNKNKNIKESSIFSIYFLLGNASSQDLLLRRKLYQNILELNKEYSYHIKRVIRINRPLLPASRLFVSLELWKEEKKNYISSIEWNKSVNNQSEEEQYYFSFKIFLLLYTIHIKK